MKLRINSFSFGRPGKQNEDAILILPVENAHVVAVADGVGGAAGGHDASDLAIELTRSYWANDGQKQPMGVLSFVGEEFAKRASALKKEFATTLTICYIKEHLAHVEHVGDARLYHLRAQGILTRTRDQTEVRQLLDEGVLTPRTADRYPRRNVLLSVLSAKGNFQVYNGSFELLRGDRILLATDGVHKAVSKLQLRDLSVANEETQQFCDQLAAALHSGPIEDDCSAIVVDVVE